MVFVVNGSLRMSSGKMSAQVAHSAIDLYHQLFEKRSKALNHWREYGETKIVLRGASAEELLDIQSQAKTSKSIITSLIQDAGRTEIASGSVTCVGLFGTNEQLDPITGHLKLMQDCLKCGGNNTQQKN
jgi:PTH2 family peptidyl-tRNA hydrolase